MIRRALALALLAGPAAAQGWADQPAMDALVDRLSERGTFFNAMVDTAPDEDLLEMGRLVAMGGSENGGAGMACFTCHGVEGAGDGSGAFPRLAGLPAWYHYKQLTDYASGARPHPVMSGVALKLTAEEMEAVAAYYAVVDAPYPQSGPWGDTLELQWGAQLAAVGSAEKGIPACVNCHGARGSGMPPSVPYLAGQYGNYIALQLQLWKDGVRDNDPQNVMYAIAKKMSEADMVAVGAYYERVRPLEPRLAAEPQTSADPDLAVAYPSN